MTWITSQHPRVWRPARKHVRHRQPIIGICPHIPPSQTTSLTFRHSFFQLHLFHNISRLTRSTSSVRLNIIGRVDITGRLWLRLNILTLRMLLRLNILTLRLWMWLRLRSSSRRSSIRLRGSFFRARFIWGFSSAFALLAEALLSFVRWLSLSLSTPAILFKWELMRHSRIFESVKNAG
jgi:hypothetical protein